MSFRTASRLWPGLVAGSHLVAPSVRGGGLGRAVDARASVDCVPRAGGLRPWAGAERARAGHAGGAERPRDGFSRGQNGSIAALQPVQFDAELVSARDHRAVRSTITRAWLPRSAFRCCDPCRTASRPNPAARAAFCGATGGLRNSHRAMRNPHTRPYARNTRRAHHTGSTGDSGKIEGSICTNSEGQL